MPSYETPARMQEYEILLENVYIQLLVDKPWKNANQELTNPYLLHTHMFAELFVCESGELILETVNGYITLYKGEAAIVPPRVPHIRRSKGDPYTGATVGFMCRPKNNNTHNELYRRLCVFTAGSEILIFRKSPFILTTVQKISDRAPKKENLLPVIYLSELLLMLLHEEYETNSDVSTGSAAVNYLQNPKNLLRMRELNNIIDSEYAKNYNIKEIANRLFISTRQLDRIAINHYGKPLHQVVADKRINAAVNLIESTDKTVEAIASEVGFNSRVGFYREFKKRHNMTPAEYRKSKKKNAD